MPPPEGNIPIGTDINFVVDIPVIHEGEGQGDRSGVVIIAEAREELPRAGDVHPVVSRCRIRDGSSSFRGIPPIAAGITASGCWRLSVQRCAPD